MSLLQERGSSAMRSSHCDEKSNYFDWDHYIDSFWGIMSASSSLEDYEDNVNSLMDNLLKHDCEDLVLGTKLINFIAVYRNSKDLKNKEAAVAKVLIAGASALDKSEIYDQCMEVNAKNFILALRRSDSKLLRLLMKYGIDVLAVDQEAEEKEIMRTLKQFYYYALGVERVIFDDLVLDGERLHAMSEFLAKTYYRKLSKRLGPDQHTRLMQVLLGVEAILRKRRENGKHQEYAECVRIYFRDIPWPFISSSEIRFYLDKFGCDKPLFLESLCRDFNELFPEFPSTLYAPMSRAPKFTPRSLKELCRAEMREILTYGNVQRTTTLPVAVSTLCIPHTLKNYILGEE